MYLNHLAHLLSTEGYTNGKKTTFKVGLENQFLNKFQTPLDPHVTFRSDGV